jgi:hypothetical protein
MTAFAPNTVIVEVDPLPGEDGYDWARPILSWGRGFLVGALLSVAYVLDMLGPSSHAIPL